MNEGLGMRLAGKNHSTERRTGPHRESGEIGSADWPSWVSIWDQPEAAHGDGCRPTSPEGKSGDGNG
jgi:hypothetical protein